MRKYALIALVAFVAGGLLTGAAAMITRNEPAPASADGVREDSVRENSGMGGSVWGADYFPNVPLITHDGQHVRFFDDLAIIAIIASTANTANTGDPLFLPVPVRAAEEGKA